MGYKNVSEDMVERVALAIYAARGSVGLRENCVADARAAIAAMREPTREMIDAGYIQLSGERHQRPREPQNAWPAMIDAALKSHAKPA